MRPASVPANAENGSMDTQGRNELQPFETARGGGARSEARVEVVADSVMGPLFPAPAAPQIAASGRAKWWFSVASVVILIALAACAAALVAATYGPVFTPPLMGP
jgi:hypothetical protein